MYRGPIGPDPIGPTQGSMGTALGSRGIHEAQIYMGIQHWDPRHPARDPKGGEEKIG